jgi:hypothetical protein
MMGKLGMSYDNNRDLYQVLGYAQELSYEDYLGRFRRGDICKRLVNAPVDQTWRNPPDIHEEDSEEGSETPFEQAWKEMVKRLCLWEQFRRVDRLTGLGRYGALYMGFGVDNPSQPVSKGRGNSLLYVHPYGEVSATIQRWEDNTQNPRFGMPTKYGISFVTADKQGTSTRPVDWTRVLHIVDDPMENPVYGTPRLEAVFNRLQDLEKIVGGSGEMFWRGARPGHAAEADKDAQFTPEITEALEDQFDEFDHGLRRWLQVSGIKINPLAPQVSSPSEHMWAQLELIAGTEGIPLRILIGSERGELASSQDEKNWKEQGQERMHQFAEPNILRPFIDRCIWAGVLPEPRNGYRVDWPKLWTPGDKEQAEVSKIRTEAYATYINAPGGADLFPPELFFKFIMNLPSDQIEAIVKAVGEWQAQDREEEVE